MSRLRALLALAAWLLAVAFVGPGHVALHHHEGDAEHCGGCARHGDAPSWEALCSIPDCPEPTHHHHGTPDEDDLRCVTCATVSVPPPASIEIQIASTPTARVALFGDVTAGHAAVDRPRARAPPAGCC